ncbi:MULTISPECIES: PAAR domain-containing protein [Burkholderiaceae]|uniref:PAAR domain-containing protein n=1 Tax=Burkholderiaceae TaxID=119060 RepID=UPI00094CE051|nr:MULTISPECIES: PAAR domain-containing protein [Burkholderiaceae]
MKRYVIKRYDKSTSGAFVVQGAELGTRNGTPIAIIGSPVYCPACKSERHIVATGPRHLTSFGGKEIALENDWGLGKCRPPPRMTATQNTMSQSFTSEELAAQGYTLKGAPFLRYYDEGIRRRDSNSLLPIANVPYRIKDGSQILATGVTDANGRIKRVMTNTASNNVIEIQHSGATRR